MSTDKPPSAKDVGAIPTWENDKPPSAETLKADADAEPTCRICFDTAHDDDPLIAPCKCDGSQKYVHANCLRRWMAHQRLEAASQRTDGRAKAATCDVCHAPLSCEGPSDAELLEVVRPGDGRAIAAVIGPGMLLVSTKSDAPDTSQLPGAMGVFLLRRAGHWLGHVFLLYDAEEGGASDGSDCISGVNLTREITLDKDLAKVTGTAPNEVLYPDALMECLPMDKALKGHIRSAKHAGVDVRICIGGPCSSKAIVCVHGEQDVPGSEPALCGAVAGEVRHGGAVKAVLEAAKKRAEARKKKGGSSSEAEGDSNTLPPTVFLCFGHAKWGRSQLQNEVLRGDWGCKAGEGVNGQLVLGPANGMSWEVIKVDEGTKFIRPPEQP